MNRVAVLLPAHPPHGIDIAVRAGELEVRGAQLRLRYPGPDDAPRLFQLASDPAVTRFFSWGPYRDESEATAWLATLPARRAAGVALEFAVVSKADELLGITALSEFSPRDRRCVVGTWLGRRYWGTFVNRHSKALVAALAFGPLAIERLGAYSDVDNTRSQIALERVGFRREGVLRAFHRHDDKPRDVVSFSLLRSQWRSSTLAQIEATIVGQPPSDLVSQPRSSGG
jgi:ribosomal-protein-alanine N-acetyltransferase